MRLALGAAGAFGISIGSMLACGGDEQGAGTIRNGEQRLAPAELRVVRGTQQKVREYCSKRLDELARRRSPATVNPTPVRRALDQLAALAQRKPEAETPDGASVRLALGDIAEDLEGTNCDSQLVARIDALLAELRSR